MFATKSLNISNIFGYLEVQAAQVIWILLEIFIFAYYKSSSYFYLCDQTYILIYFHINGRYQGLCLIDNKNRKHWKLATFFRSWQRKEILKKERKNYSNFTHNFNMSTLWYTVLNNISPVIFPVISLDITGYQISKFILLIWESNVAIIICSFIAYIQSNYPSLNIQFINHSSEHHYCID